MSNWVRFFGDYEKKHYDIELDNGDIEIACWPNAGTFHNINGKIIKGHDVKYIKESEFVD